MTNPIPEQIEAAAIPIFEAHAGFAFADDLRGSRAWSHALETAEVALIAAAGDTPQEPTITEAELNRIICPVLFNSMNYPEPHRMLGKDFSKLRGALVRALIEGLTDE